MNLQDQIALDNRTFINPAEFAEAHMIDGRVVECVLVDNEGQLSGDLEQVAYQVTRTLSVEASRLPKRPVVGKALVIDNEYHTVLDCSTAMGLTTVTLTRGASR